MKCFAGNCRPAVPNERLRGVRKPIGASVVAGLVASLCCGGSLVFASIGLRALYGALGLSRYVPQVLMIGALSIVAINYVLFRRAASILARGGLGDPTHIRRRMLVGATVGLASMALSFVLLEWLNHAIVHPAAFLGRREYREALIPGVPNARLLYVIESFAALALLWALPFPGPARDPHPPLGLRNGVLLISALILALLAGTGIGPFAAAGPAAPTPHRSVPHGRP